jgi:hypothetical protein
MGQVDAYGDEYHDLRTDEGCAGFDAQTAGMTPKPLSAYAGERMLHRAKHAAKPFINETANSGE